MDNTEKGRPRDLGPEQVRLMQGLAQEVTIRRPQVLDHVLSSGVKVPAS